MDKVLERQQQVRHQVEDFLYQEAALLDSGKFGEWLDLFTSDAVYWVPCNEYDYDPMSHVSIIYDDRERLEERVWRLNSGQSPAQIPPSRTRHLITNVMVEGEEDGKLKVSSYFLLVELRRGVQTVYAGRNEHHLREEGGRWKICLKKVELINNNEPLGNLSFLL